MTTVATRSGTKAGAQAPATAPISSESVAHIVAQIELGLMDSYLRATWEAVAQRKKGLEANGELPVQHKIEPALIKWDIDHDGAAEDLAVNVTVSAPVPAFPTPALIDQPAPVRRGRKPKASGLGHVSARPMPNPHSMPSVMPLTRASWAGMPDTAYFHHAGLAYLKADFKGHQVQGQTSSGDVITFQISGVGDKSIKCLIVTEPLPGSMSGKTNLWEKWRANDPVFMPHSLIAPWLIVPTDVTPYI